jgi:hypothetical protein
LLPPYLIAVHPLVGELMLTREAFASNEISAKPTIPRSIGRTVAGRSARRLRLLDMLQQ